MKDLKPTDFWSPKTRLLNYNAPYYGVFGTKSNGKTYGLLSLFVEDYLQHGRKFGVIRRWDTDFRGQKSARTVFQSLTRNAFGENDIEKLSNGKYCTIEYYSHVYWLCRRDKENKIIRTREAIGYGFAVNRAEDYNQSSGYYGCDNLMYDEAIARDGRYLPDEFDKLQILISNIVRNRDTARIFIVGNTWNRYCPLFRDLGIEDIKNMHPGDLKCYYADDGTGKQVLNIVVEFTRPLPKKDGKLGRYVRFGSTSNVIKTGDWDIGRWAKMPKGYRIPPENIIMIFYIDYYDELYQGNIYINDNGAPLIFFHQKTTPIRNPADHIIFSTKDGLDRWGVDIAAPNIIDNIITNRYPSVQKIKGLLVEKRIRFSNDEVGEAIKAWLNDSATRASIVFG